MPSVLITGAGGFVGSALCRQLLGKGYRVRALIRRNATGIKCLGDGIEVVSTEGIETTTDWGQYLDGVDKVVHLAAHVHQIGADALTDRDVFHRVNALATKRLAEAAAGRVDRMVFLSTIKVHGQSSDPDKPLRAHDATRPQDDYAASKDMAEQYICRLAQTKGLNYCILRPPLVYGPGVGANFLRLMNLVQKGLPIPLGGADNKRSLIYIDNLVSALSTCLEHPKAIGRTYLVTDGEDVSTAELIRRIAAAMNRPARLVNVPPALIQLAGKLLGKQAEIERLQGTLAADSSVVRSELGWAPPVTMQKGIESTVRWFIHQS